MMSALYAQGSTTEESGIFIRLAGCSFLRNSVTTANVICIGWEYVRAEISDSLFANNKDNALFMYDNANSQIILFIIVSYVGTGHGTCHEVTGDVYRHITKSAQVSPFCRRHAVRFFAFMYMKLRHTDGH